MAVPPLRANGPEVPSAGSARTKSGTCARHLLSAGPAPAHVAGNRDAELRVHGASRNHLSLPRPQVQLVEVHMPEPRRIVASGEPDEQPQSPDMMTKREQSAQPAWRQGGQSVEKGIGLIKRLVHGQFVQQFQNGPLRR